MAGHLAAILAARSGVASSIIEAGTMLVGAMTRGGVYKSDHFFNKKRSSRTGNSKGALYTTKRDRRA